MLIRILDSEKRIDWLSILGDNDTSVVQNWVKLINKHFFLSIGVIVVKSVTCSINDTYVTCI